MKVGSIFFVSLIYTMVITPIKWNIYPFYLDDPINHVIHIVSIICFILIAFLIFLVS